jgi:hypothetical protein
VCCPSRLVRHDDARRGAMNQYLVLEARSAPIKVLV